MPKFWFRKSKNANCRQISRTQQFLDSAEFNLDISMPLDDSDYSPLNRGPRYTLRLAHPFASLPVLTYASMAKSLEGRHSMFILIPTTEYAATLEGSITKNVTCENCGHMYSYPMSRIVSGIEKVLFSSSQGPEKALKKARANLAKVLETEHDDVPCPACNWHQSSHVAYVRSQLYLELKNLAGAFFIFAGLVLGVILFFFALFILVDEGHELPKASSILTFALVVLCIASPGFLLRGFRSLLVLNYRPNG